MTPVANTVAKKNLSTLAREARERPGLVRWSFWLAVVLVIVGFLDVISTDIALATGGAREANPVVRGLMDVLGPFWVVPKMVLHVVLGYMVVWYPNRPTLATMSAVAGLVLAAAINNFIIYANIVGVV